MTALSILATLQSELGDLDRIERLIKVFGMVNVAPGFNQTPAVIDGCSDVLVEIFGEAGRHTRSAVGLAESPVRHRSRDRADGQAPTADLGMSARRDSRTRGAFSQRQRPRDLRARSVCRSR